MQLHAGAHAWVTQPSPWTSAATWRVGSQWVAQVNPTHPIHTQCTSPRPQVFDHQYGAQAAATVEDSAAVVEGIANMGWAAHGEGVGCTRSIAAQRPARARDGVASLASPSAAALP